MARKQRYTWRMSIGDIDVWIKKNNYLLISVSVYLEWTNGGKDSKPMALVVYEKKE